MPFRLYMDEDTLHGGLTQAVRVAGIDCLTTIEAGRKGTSDESQLLFAATHQRTIVTSNQRDFVRLFGDWAGADLHHHGIVIITTQQTPIGLIAAKLRALQAERDTEAMRDAILFINATGLS